MKDYLEQFYASYTSSADFYEESLKTQVILAFQDWFESSNCIQKDIAQKIGIKPTALSRLLAGKTNMTMKSAAQLLWVADFLPVLKNAREYYYVSSKDYSVANVKNIGIFLEKVPEADCITSADSDRHYALAS